MKKILSFIIVLLLTYTPGFSQPGSNCQTAVQLYNLDSFTVVSVPAGDTFKPACFTYQPTDGHWYKFSVCTTGQLSWLCTPTTPCTEPSTIFSPGNGVELDWAMYDISNGCPTPTSQTDEIDCNYNYEENNSDPIGMSASSTNNCSPVGGGPQAGTAAGELCPPMTVTAGRTYAIFINNYTNTVPTGWNFNFNGSTFQMTLVDSFSTSPDTICGSSGIISFTDNNSEAVWQLWNFGDGSSDTTGSSVSHNYSQPGLYTVTLQDSITGGCSGATQKSVDISTNIDTTLATQTICPGQPVTLTAPGAQGGSYVWSTGGLTTQGITISPLATTTYTVTCSLSNSCTITASVTVDVDSLPVPAIVQHGDTLQTQHYDSYQWQFNGTDISGGNSQSIVVTQNGTYTVIVADTNSCSAASAIFNVTALALESANADNDLKLFPNPNTGNFTIQFTNDEVKEIEITDAVGRIIITSTKVTRQKYFNMNELANGIYLLRINYNNYLKSLKFSIVR